MNILNKYVSNFTNKVVSKIEDKISPMFDDTPAKSISEFRSRLSGGLAQTNQFIVTFSLPSMLMESSFMSYFGINNYSDEIGIYCYQVSSPSKKMKTENINVYNNLNRIIPDGYTWENLKLSFLETSDRKIFHLFDNWINKITNPVTNCGTFYDDSYGSIKIRLLDRAGKEKGKIIYEEAIPVAVNISNLNWNSTNELVSVDVEFSYIYPTTEASTLSNLFNAAVNIKDSDAGKLVSQVTKWF